MAGLAQKGGAVWSHLQIATSPEDIKTVRLGSAGAKAVLGCDLVVSASQKTMDTTRQGETRMVVNTHQQMTGDFTRNVDFQFPGQSLQRTITKGVGEGQAEFVDATPLPPRSWATASPPTCSCSATRFRRAWCRFRPRPSIRPSSSTARR
jgi:indolepyruvate ferredoxin oxidoreductase